MKTNENKVVVPDIEPVKSKAFIAKRIHQYDLLGHYIKTFDSISQAQKELGIQGAGIYRVIQKKAKSCHGFQFKLAD